MAKEATSTLPRIVRNPWTAIPQRTFNGIIIGLIGASQIVLLFHFMSTSPEIGFSVGSGGLLLLWLAWNTAYDEDPLENYFADDGSHGWFHVVVWSVIAVAAMIASVSVILTT